MKKFAAPLTQLVLPARLHAKVKRMAEKNGVTLEEAIIQLLDQRVPVEQRDLTAKQLRKTFEVIIGGGKL